MRMVLLTAFLIASFAVHAQETIKNGPPEDIAGITQALQDRYLAGWAASDSAKLRSAFYPRADLRYINAEDKFIIWPINDYIAGTKPGPAREIQTHIYYIDVVGNAGQAKLHIVYNGVRFTDYMNLLKIEDRWYIVSKIFKREALKK